MKDLVEVLPPSRDRIFVAFRMEAPRDHMSFTLVDDLPLYPGHGPAIWTLVSGPPSARTIGSTYVVSCSIAPSTD